MGPAEALASVRAWLLADAAVAALVGQRVHVSRADVAGIVPALALELSGGSGQLNQAMDQVDLSVDAWSSASWAEALAVLDAASARLRGATYQDGLAPPILAVTVIGAPRQLGDADYYHAACTITAIIRRV